jgi:hypothetical protein
VFERGGLALQGDAGGFFAVDGPRVKQVQVAVVRFNVGFVGQTGRGVFGREAGNVESCLHRALDRGFGKIRSAGIAPAVLHIDRHTQRFVAVALHVFQLTFAHTDRQAATLRRFGPRVGGPQFFGVVQGDVDQPFKMVTRVAEAVVGVCMGGGGRGVFFHGAFHRNIHEEGLEKNGGHQARSGRYDTCHPAPALHLKTSSPIHVP